MASCYPTIQEMERVQRLTVCQYSIQAKTKLPSFTGAAMANADVQIIREWTLEKHGEALWIDINASNTGIQSGCCQLIKLELGRPLLHCACRL